MKVYHHNDLDGRCSAAILNIYFSKDMKLDKQFIEIDYKDEIDVDAIEEEELVYILDFSFKPEVMRRVKERTKKIIWIDHHKTAMEYSYKEDTAGLRDTGDAACALTWKYFFHDQESPAFVDLIADYDTWTFALEDSMPFHEGMKIVDNGPTAKIWKTMLGNPAIINEIVESGYICIDYRDNYCKEMRQAAGYKVILDGHVGYALNVYGFGSSAFGDVIDRDDIEMVVSYIHDGKQYTVGLYSQKIDVAEIAKLHGGGGHTGAAGFVCKELPFHLPF